VGDDERIAALKTNLDEPTRAAVERLEVARNEYRKLYQLLLEENEKLKRGLTGQQAEKLPKNDAQLTLAILEMLLGKQSSEQAAAAAATDVKRESTEVSGYKRNKPTGRDALETANLPEISIELLPDEVKRLGLDAFEQIGVDEKRVVEHRKSSLVVIVIRRPKFKPKTSEAVAALQPVAAEAVAALQPVAVDGGEATEASEPSVPIVVAPTPELPIERGLAGPGLLADSIAKRWDDHDPLHRLERIYERDGLLIARSTLCSWHEKLAELSGALLAAMRKDTLLQPYLCTDATGVLVLHPERCKRGHFWVLVAPGLHVLFEFTESHDKKTVARLLRDYQGYLVADAHAVYDHLYVDGRIIEVACWAHARRYHFKALASDPDRARVALGHMGALFKIERDIADDSRSIKEAARQARSKPVLDKYFEWCVQQAPVVLDESPIQKAIQYSLNHEQAFRRYVDDGRLPMTNNISERELRREALGRKNWMFVGSEDGGRVNAVFVSLLASCRMHDIEPRSYLRDLFCLLPDWPAQRVLELAPAYWKQTFEQHDTQQRLAANVFRRAVLELDAHRPRA
jgi:transposase